MNYKILAPIAFVLLAVGFIAGYLVHSPQTPLSPQNIGVVPSGFIGIYYTTTTAHTVRDGYGSPLRVDINGNLILSN